MIAPSGGRLALFSRLHPFAPGGHHHRISTLTLAGKLRRQKSEDALYRRLAQILWILLCPRQEHLYALHPRGRWIREAHESRLLSAPCGCLIVMNGADPIAVTKTNRRWVQRVALTRRTEVDQILGRADQKIVARECLGAEWPQRYCQPDYSHLPMHHAFLLLWASWSRSHPPAGNSPHPHLYGPARGDKSMGVISPQQSLVSRIISPNGIRNSRGRCIT